MYIFAKTLEHILLDQLKKFERWIEDEFREIPVIEGKYRITVTIQTPGNKVISTDRKFEIVSQKEVNG